MEPNEVPTIVRRFEPILHFHPTERFFPSDAKRYMERCALWRVIGSKRDAKNTWGGSESRPFPRNPTIPRTQIAALAGEGGTFIGTFDNDTADELFLDFKGWREHAGVTSDSKNNYTNIDEIALFYGDDRDNGFDKPLQQSRFWYHAEVFDDQRLRRLLGGQTGIAFDTFLTFSADSALVLYNLFFPGVDDKLENCGDTKKAELFGSFAGQWACVALLIERKPVAGSPARSAYEPTFIGMTSRLPGALSMVAEDRRSGMIAFPIKLATVLDRDRGPGQDPGRHPRIFVGKGTHGLYLQPGDQLVTPLAEDDYARKSCGSFETLEAKKKHEKKEQEEADDRGRTFWYKVLAWTVVTRNPFAGAIVGLDEAILEAGGASKLAGISDPPDPPVPPQFDHAPNAQQFGFVVHPQGLVPPILGPGAKLVSWPRFAGGETPLDTGLANRRYSLLLGTQAEPFVRPPWVPNDGGTAGFRGRWGNRVADDPATRRAGMTFRAYWEAFLFAIAKAKSKP
jgi:hypothetical protein